MKRMELKIALTFATVFVVTLIINGIYSATTLKGDFLSAKVLATSLYHALPYLVLIWIFIGHHKWLRLLVCSIALLLMNFLSYDSGYYPFRYSEFGWIDIAITVVYIVISIIASRQAKKLLKEE